MPRLKCTFRDFIDIIVSNGFEVHRQGAGSHCRYRAVIDGEVRYVDVAAHSVKGEINPNTLKSMIRQSGLPPKLFRK